MYSIPRQPTRNATNMHKYETLYISVNPERNLRFTAQLKQAVIPTNLTILFPQQLNGGTDTAVNLWRRVGVTDVSK